MALPFEFNCHIFFFVAEKVYQTAGLYCTEDLALFDPLLTKDSFVFLYVMAIEGFRGQCARDKV